MSPRASLGRGILQNEAIDSGKQRGLCLSQELIIAVYFLVSTPNDVS